MMEKHGYNVLGPFDLGCLGTIYKNTRDTEIDFERLWRLGTLLDTFVPLEALNLDHARVVVNSPDIHGGAVSEQLPYDRVPHYFGVAAHIGLVDCLSAGFPIILGVRNHPLRNPGLKSAGERQLDHAILLIGWRARGPIEDMKNLRFIFHDGKERPYDELPAKQVLDAATVHRRDFLDQTREFVTFLTFFPSGNRRGISSVIHFAYKERLCERAFGLQPEQCKVRHRLLPREALLQTYFCEATDENSRDVASFLDNSLRRDLDYVWAQEYYTSDSTVHEGRISALAIFSPLGEDRPALMELKPVPLKQQVPPLLCAINRMRESPIGGKELVRLSVATRPQRYVKARLEYEKGPSCGLIEKARIFVEPDEEFRAL